MRSGRAWNAATNLFSLQIPSSNTIDYLIFIRSIKMGRIFLWLHVASLHGYFTAYPLGSVIGILRKHEFDITTGHHIVNIQSLQHLDSSPHYIRWDVTLCQLLLIETLYRTCVKKVFSMNLFIFSVVTIQV